MEFFLEAFELGGPALYLILAFGVLTLMFILERYFALYLSYKKSAADFRTVLLKEISRGDLMEGEKIALQSQTGLGRVAAVGFNLRRRGSGDEEIQARMDEQLAKEISKIDQRTGFLAMFGNVATLVGLLGTIMGMIHSFAAVASASPVERATLLSKGIAEAMYCTAFGLFVAVPALVCFAIFQSKTDKLIEDLTQKTSEIYHDLVFFVERSLYKSSDVVRGMQDDKIQSRSPEREFHV